MEAAVSRPVAEEDAILADQAGLPSQDGRENIWNARGVLFKLKGGAHPRGPPGESGARFYHLC